MKTVLEWSIKIFWAVIGCFAVTCLIGMIFHLSFARSALWPRHAEMWLLMSLMVFLNATLIYTAYSALFRFSTIILGPTVFIISIVMWLVAMKGQREFLQPLIEQDIKTSPFSIMPFVGLLTILVTLFGAIRFYRVMLKILDGLLFPSHSIRYSAARNF